MARNFIRASSQYLGTTTPPVTAAPFTVGGWLKRGDSATTQNPFGLGLSTSLKFFGINWNGGGGDAFKLRAQHYDGTNNGIALGTTAIGVGQVVHACAVFTSTSSRTIYANGVAEATDTTAVGNAFTPDRWDLATLDNGAGKTDFLEGDLAEWAVWNVALTDAEVAALGKGVCPLLIRPNALVGYWPLFGNDSPEPDRWNNRYDLTLTNSPTKADHPRIYYPYNSGFGSASSVITFAADGGAFTLTGSAASLLASRQLVVDPGSFVITGFDANRGYLATCVAGGFTITGSSTDSSIGPFPLINALYTTSQSLQGIYKPSTTIDGLAESSTNPKGKR